jgi:subtilisin family serine protease
MFGGRGETSPTIFQNALNEIEKINPDVVSISVGTLGNPNDVYARIIDRCRSKGIIVIVSAGNYGPKPSTVTSPGVSDSAICVASFDFHQTADYGDDTISDWSSRGPVTGVRPKPDIAAPGESLYGPWASQNQVKSGTSMACPLVAAGTALIIANNKGTSDTVKSLYFWDRGIAARAYEDALKESCISKGDENSWGAGIPQFDKVNEIYAAKLNWLLIQWFIIMGVIIGATIGATILIRRRKNKKWYLKKKIVFGFDSKK